MNDSLRWLLVLGCLCIVFLEAPQDFLQVLQDFSGAYPAQPASALVDAPPETPTRPSGAALGSFAPGWAPSTWIGRDVLACTSTLLTQPMRLSPTR